MHISTKNAEPVDIAHQQCSRAWSLLRTLAGQFSDRTAKFEGNGEDALEIIYTVMDLVADASDQAEAAWKAGLARSEKGEDKAA